MNSDFPGAQQPKGNFFHNIRELPESVKEEAPEENLSGEDETGARQRGKIDIFMDCDEFNSRGRASNSCMGLPRSKREIAGRRHKSMDEGGHSANRWNTRNRFKMGARTPVPRVQPLQRSHSSRWLQSTELSVPE